MNVHQIGQTVVHRVHEREGPGMAPEMLLPDYDRSVFEQHRSWLAPGYWMPEKEVLVSSMHGWLLKTRHHTILVDTCVGNHKERPTFQRMHRLNTPYLEHLAAAGATPDQIDIVMCTHLHADHVGWNTRLVDGKW